MACLNVVAYLLAAIACATATGILATPSLLLVILCEHQIVKWIRFMLQCWQMNSWR